MYFLRAMSTKSIQSYDIKSLANGIYNRHLSSFVPMATRKQKPRKIRPLATSLELMTPYIVTTMGYLSLSIDRDILYDFLEPIGHIQRIAYKYKAKIKGIEGEKEIDSCLPNHVDIILEIDSGSTLRVRISKDKMEVIRSKKESDLMVAWEILSSCMKKIKEVNDSLYEGDVLPRLIYSVTAMRNYTYDLGYYVDLDMLESLITKHPQWGFRAMRTPSLQSGLQLTYPVSSLSDAPKAKRRKSSEKQAYHFFRVYGSGSTTLSSKRAYRESCEVQDLFLSIMADLKPLIATMRK